MQMETNHMTCSAVRNASPPHLASPTMTVPWNMVHELVFNMVDGYIEVCCMWLNLS